MALAEPSATRWWLAERGDDIVGFVGIGPSRDPIDPDLGKLDTIAVDPVAWRAGVGKALMSLAIEGLGSEGYRSAVLWTLSDYPQAESIYVATGWRISIGAIGDCGISAATRTPIPFSSRQSS
jgi:GNAT superfamily N-acetyltransferase